MGFLGIFPPVSEPAALFQRGQHRVQPPAVHTRRTAQVLGGEAGFVVPREEYCRELPHFPGRPHVPILAFGVGRRRVPEPAEHG